MYNELQEYWAFGIITPMGKIEVVPTKEAKTQRDYSSGVY